MLLDLSQIILLFLAGVFGGVLNSVAGGGSFITFPALLFVGIPPIVANATNTFAACAGYLSVPTRLGWKYLKIAVTC
ncbi:predicted permease [Vibrio variabilis]|uniref:Probable membrane transporter protein n=1 Tax=Vibrio variabilis TaxID=990271 RepID=A0ABQ0JRX7_9VIBR|nr:predicted permease [Vibrio variabilis]